MAFIRVLMYVFVVAAVVNGKKKKHEHHHHKHDHKKPGESKGECKDADSWCTHDARHCEKEAKEWKHCSKACDICGTCVDSKGKDFCKQAESKGWCSSPKYKDKYCARTCGGRCNQEVSNECGVSKRRATDSSNRLVQALVGGTDATPGYYPWQVGIYYEGEFLCGGSLINETQIVTAAHCFNYRSPNGKDYQIRLGDHDRTKLEGTEQTISGSRLTVYEDYLVDRDDHDIALITLSEKAKLSDYINPICLPTKKLMLNTQSECYVSGWGKKAVVFESAEILQHGQIPIVSQEDCAKRNKFNNHIVTDKMICGGFNDGSSFLSGCHGDSGGPLQCKQEGRFVLHGTVSWGSPLCSGLDRFTVFTRVSAYIDWIYKNS